MNQPTASLSPYALLHLRDGAPRDLVDETYWLLVRRLKYGVIDDVEGLRQLDGLNAAYESIVRNGVRQDTASSERGGDRRQRWSRRKNRAPIVRDPYQTLFVAEDADPDIALLAAKVLAGRPPSDANRRDWNEAVTEAAATVSARWEAAQSTNGVHATDVVDEERTHPAHANEEVVAEEAEAGIPEVAVVEQATAAEAEVVAAPAQPNEQTVPATEPAGEIDHDDVAESVVDGDPLEELAASVMPPAIAVISASPESDVRATVVDAATVAAPQGDATAPSQNEQTYRTPEASRPRGWFERLRGRSEERAAMVEAENERLLGLCEADEPSDRESAARGNGHSRHDGAVITQPELRIVPQGPVTLELAGDEGYDFLLGDESDPARIQIWRQGRRYLLQQVSGPVARVGGAELVSPIVVLEDGDEVACGDDVVLISFGEAPPDVASSNG